MSNQNINHWANSKWFPKLSLGSYDMSLTTDETEFNQEVVFSPYLISQTYGNKLPFYFDLNDSGTTQNIVLNYKEYNTNNVIVSQNNYNPKNENLNGRYFFPCAFLLFFFYFSS
jgi:hypothetical protein